MKRKLIILPILLSTLSIFSSCDSFFEVDDRERITEELVLSKDADVAAMWAYLYHNFEMGFQQVGNSMLAAACDEADNNQPFHQVQLFNQGSWNSINNPENPWSSLYAGIRNATKFLKATDVNNNPRFTYEEFRVTDPVKYAKLRREYKAYCMDAEFIKAYCHFELWKRYGEIPIVDEVLTQSQALAQPRKSTAEVIAHILKWVDKVIPQFAELEQMEGSEYVRNKWNDANFGRLTKGAVLAFKARVLLYAASPLNTADGQFDKELCDQAAQTAAEVINLGIYSTNITYGDLQNNKNSSNPENILDCRAQIRNFNYLESWNYPKGGSDQWINKNVGSNATCPSQNLVDAYETLDGEPVDPQDPYVNRDPRLSLSIIYNGMTFNDLPVECYVGGKAEIGEKGSTTTGYYLKKFVLGKLNLNNGTTGPHVWYLFRYAEVLLNYAEAMFYAHGADAKRGYVKQGEDLSAVDAINIIRSRNGVQMPKHNTLTEAKLRNERRVELAFEGHRFWDVRRWKIAEQTENEPLMGMSITKSGNNLRYEVVKIEDRKFLPAMYHHPIPFTEMTNYPAWTQNQGWK